MCTSSTAPNDVYFQQKRGAIIKAPIIAYFINKSGHNKHSTKCTIFHQTVGTRSAAEDSSCFYQKRGHKKHSRRFVIFFNKKWARIGSRAPNVSHFVTNGHRQQSTRFSIIYQSNGHKKQIIRFNIGLYKRCTISRAPNVSYLFIKTGHKKQNTTCIICQQNKWAQATNQKIWYV